MSSRPQKQCEVQEVTGATRTSATLEWKVSDVPVEKLMCDQRVKEYRRRLQKQPPHRLISVKKLVDWGHENRIERIRSRLQRALERKPTVSDVDVKYDDKKYEMMVAFSDILTNQEISAKLKAILKDCFGCVFDTHVVAGTIVVEEKEIIAMPRPLKTQPGTKIVFNAPYDDKHTYHIKIVNSFPRRIGWVIKTSDDFRLRVAPCFGHLGFKETARVTVTCAAFAYGQVNINDDRLVIETKDYPNGQAMITKEWFEEGIVYRKNLLIEYNP